MSLANLYNSSSLESINDAVPNQFGYASYLNNHVGCTGAIVLPDAATLSVAQISQFAPLSSGATGTVGLNTALIAIDIDFNDYGGFNATSTDYIYLGPLPNFAIPPNQFVKEFPCYIYIDVGSGPVQTLAKWRINGSTILITAGAGATFTSGNAVQIFSLTGVYSVQH